MLHRARKERVWSGGVSIRRNKKALRSGLDCWRPILLSGCGATSGLRPKRASARCSVLQIAAGGGEPFTLLGRGGASGGRILFGLDIETTRVQIGIAK